jgi:hypothetical protein
MSNRWKIAVAAIVLLCTGVTAQAAAERTKTERLGEGGACGFRNQQRKTVSDSPLSTA